MADTDLSECSVDVLLGAVLRSSKLELLDRAGDLERLAQADPYEIASWLEGREIDGSERPRTPRRGTLERARAVAAAFELARRVERARARLPDRLTSAEAVARWATARIGALTHEELWMLALDGRGNLRSVRNIARGGLHGASVRAADPLRAALRADASAFVLVHNHPSGDPTPSREDVALTARVAAAARIVGVPLLDHVVVAREGFACVPMDDGLSRPAADDSAR